MSPSNVAPVCVPSRYHSSRPCVASVAVKNKPLGPATSVPTDANVVVSFTTVLAPASTLKICVGAVPAFVPSLAAKYSVPLTFVSPNGDEDAVPIGFTSATNDAPLVSAFQSSVP